MTLGRLMIWPPDIYTRHELTKKAEAALNGGGNLLVFSDASLSDQEFRSAALDLKEAAHQRNVPLIVADRVEIARDIDADGVHLTHWDESVATLRTDWGSKKLIGLDVSIDPAGAEKAQRLGVDYIRLGPVDAYASQPAKGQITLATFRNICHAGIKTPIYGYGGISLSTVQRVLEAGAYGIAMIHIAYDAEDVAERARLFSAKIQSWLDRIKINAPMEVPGA